MPAIGLAWNPYRCRHCGASSYVRLVQRSVDGAMTYADRYRCSGCPLTFVDPKDWHRSAPQARDDQRGAKGSVTTN